MIPPPGAIHTHGRGGVDVVFIHGTGTDKASWGPLAALLRDRVRGTVYDRRGHGAWPLADGARWPHVTDHADDAADVIEGLGASSVHVCAMSFGAVVVLELLTRRPELVRSATLFEPPLAMDAGRSVRRVLLDQVQRAVESGAPERGAEFFYRRSLGDAWNALPAALRATMTGRGRQILHDLQANAVYCVPHAELRRVEVPVLLLRGGRSSAVFEPSLEALHAALPRSRRGVVDRAEHHPRGDAWHDFAAVVQPFIGL